MLRSVDWRRAACLIARRPDRGGMGVYIAARDAYVSRASRLVVRRPKTILVSVLAAVVVAGAALVLSGFSISPSTQYEWDT